MATSLKDKLQIKKDRLLVLNAPEENLKQLGKELKGILIETSARGQAEAILLFVNSLAEAEKLGPKAVKTVKQDGVLWIAYPKGVSGVKTDVNRDKLWPAVAKTGWRPVRQVAIDAVWTALRFRPEAAVKTRK